MSVSEQARLHGFAREIGDRFSTQPIIGVHNQGLWFKREALERDLAYGLGNVTQHICVDGPSGTGKTSLAQHVLVSHQTPFISVQVFQDMTWAHFCRNFVEIPKRSKSVKTIGAQGALSLFRGASASADLRYTEEYCEKDSLELLLSMASAWTPSDVGRWLEINGITLIVDDLEHASQELNMRLASLCKLMGQSHSGKVILIGTDDVLLRLLSENPSISGRITEITVGGLASPVESASFLMGKFKAMDVRTPLTSNASKIDKEKVVNYIYDAANGLMKELNELGTRMGREVSVAGNLSVKAISKVCLDVIREKRFDTRKELKQLIRIVGSSADTIEIVNFLSSRGASAITYVAEIQDQLIGKWTDDQIQSTLEILTDHDVVTVTGAARKRVFFRNPTMLNAILTELRAKGETQISLGLVGGTTRSLPAPSRK